MADSSHVEESSPKSNPVASNLASGSALNSRKLKVSSLNDLEQTTLESLLVKKKDYESKITSRFAENAIPPGIYEDEDKTYWVCPASFFTEDNVIGSMIVDLAQCVGVKVKTVTADTTLSSSWSENFLTGCWFGLYSTTNQRRSRAKKDYELGRTCTFSLIVKSIFLTSDFLGAKALVKDNFFFGNAQEEVSGKSKVPFFIKTKLRSFFTDARWGDFLFGLLNFTASKIGFQYLQVEEQDKVVLTNLVPLDQVITNCYPTVVSKKGRKETVKVRKPNPIRASPLYKKEEMELFHSVSNPIFTDLNQFNNSYEDSVMSEGFDTVVSVIRQSIKVRWEALQRFANRTKLRLQSIRKLTGNATLKKAAVLKENVDLLLTNIADPAASLVNDIIHTISAAHNVKDVLEIYAKAAFSSVKDATDFLYFKAFEMYRTILPDNHPLKRNTQLAVEPTSTYVEFNKALSGVIKTKSIVANIHKNLVNVRHIPGFKLYGRFQQLENLIKNFEEQGKMLKKLPSHATESAIRLMSEGTYSNASDFVDKMSVRCKKDFLLGLMALGWRELDEPEVTMKKVIHDFIIKASGILKMDPETFFRKT